jgi:hypothetical protein
MSKAIKTLLEKIGSRAEIARECDVEPIAVYRWAQSGRIPSQHLPGVLRVSERNKSGVAADDLIAAHVVSPSSDASKGDSSAMASCLSQDVGSASAGNKGRKILRGTA